MITIYGKPGCSFCTKAKNLCEAKQQDYAYIELGKDIEMDAFFEKFPTAKTVPQIEGPEGYIGGYGELETFLT